jgi:hypothetical protein
MLYTNLINLNFPSNALSDCATGHTNDSNRWLISTDYAINEVVTINNINYIARPANASKMFENGVLDILRKERQQVCLILDWLISLDIDYKHVVVEETKTTLQSNALVLLP